MICPIVNTKTEKKTTLQAQKKKKRKYNIECQLSAKHTHTHHTCTFRRVYTEHVCILSQVGNRCSGIVLPEESNDIGVDFLVGIHSPDEIEMVIVVDVLVVGNVCQLGKKVFDVLRVR